MGGGGHELQIRYSVPALRVSLSKLWSVALHPVYRVLSESHNKRKVLWMACEGRASGRKLESAQRRLSEKIDSMTLLAPVEYIAHLVSKCPPIPAKKKLTPFIDPAPCVFLCLSFSDSVPWNYFFSRHHCPCSCFQAWLS